MAHPPANEHHGELHHLVAFRDLLTAAVRQVTNPTASVEGELFGPLLFLSCACTRVGMYLTAAPVASPGPQLSCPFFDVLVELRNDGNEEEHGEHVVGGGAQHFAP